MIITLAHNELSIQMHKHVCLKILRPNKEMEKCIFVYLPHLTQNHRICPKPKHTTNAELHQTDMFGSLKSSVIVKPNYYIFNVNFTKKELESN